MRARLLLCLALLVNIITNAWADPLLDALLPSQPAYLKADEAFVLDTQQQDERLTVHIRIAPGYYLYKDKLTWQGNGVEIGQVPLPPATLHEDEFFGETLVYRHELNFTLPLSGIQPHAKVILGYQGCTPGLCYPQLQRPIPIQALSSSKGPGPRPDVPSASVVTGNPLAATLTTGWLPSLGLFFLLGLGLSLTPCMFPMYPILSSLILGRQTRLSGRRAFWLSLVYVQGMALTYTLLGLAVAYVGVGLQALLQQPWVLAGFSLLFVVLALAMFGLYELQLPAGLQARLMGLANQQRGGSVAGVALMGALSGLICSPCTTAPLSGALLYVAQNGDPLLGGGILYALSLGMGVPLLLLGSLGNRWLPRVGPWMVRIKVLFGFVLLVVPLLLLERILPDPWIRLAGLLLLLSAASYLLWHLPMGPWRLRALGLGLPLLAGSFWLSTVPEQETSLDFTPVLDIADLNQQLAEARDAGQPVMLDLYADWCVACKQLEQDTFADPAVQEALEPYRLLRADVTAGTDRQQALLNELQVLGLPAILLFDSHASSVSRLDGFIPPGDLVNHLEPHCQPSGSYC